MTAVEFQQVGTVAAPAPLPAPAAPVELPEAGRMLNVMLGMLLLILLSTVLMHYL